MKQLSEKEGPVATKNSDISDLKYRLSLDEAVELTGISSVQVSRWRKRLQDYETYKAMLCGAAYRKAMAEQHDHRAQGKHEIEWYTPADILELARGVLGKFDLDPASSKQAQKTVRADNYYTKDNDGLEQEWKGRVWLNPPYSQPLVGKFMSKLVAERQAGNVTSAIALTNSCTDPAWFHAAAVEADALCFTAGRLRFLNKDGEQAQSPLVGQVLFYYGDDVPAFGAAFAKIGMVATPYWGETQ